MAITLVAKLVARKDWRLDIYPVDTMVFQTDSSSAAQMVASSAEMSGERTEYMTGN